MNDWIDWNGGDCPVSPDTIVNVRLRDIKHSYGAIEFKASQLRWDVRGTGDIIAYRVVKEAPQ